MPIFEKIIELARKHKPSYISSILSVALVLFLLGILSLFMLQAKKLSDHFKENIEISLYLKEDIEETQIKQLEQALAAKDYTKEVAYISKAEAAEAFAEEFDASVLDFNPLPASLNLNLQSKYANSDSLAQILPLLEKEPLINEIVYQEGLVELVNTNIQKVATILAIAALLFLLIAFTLGDAAIRLAMYSKRFLIKSMQLVGATNGFIIRPFLQRGTLNGFLSSLIAILLLVGVVYYLRQTIPGIFTRADLPILSGIAGGITLLGVLLSLLSTSFSVRKYLRAKIEDLY
ncbi:MAG: permease-like cell division protein FtsX [Saprospiraceae bacterium]|nr:permease-like cell division protein FtsX [Saprospiraceae bacterium]